MLDIDRVKFVPQTTKLKDGREVTLRLLSLDDGDKMGDFYESIERAAYRFYCPRPLTRENACKVVATANDPTSVILVAENAEHEIVGYASYWWKETDQSSTFGICLRKSYRGARLGRVLMARLFEIAREVGPDMMNLTVQKANPRAFKLYSSMGFQVVREQMRKQVEEFPPEPEYYMERKAR